MVRIHLCPLKACGSSSVDRASAFQAEGREFEPRLPLQVKKPGRDFSTGLFVSYSVFSTLDPTSAGFYLCRNIFLFQLFDMYVGDIQYIFEECFYVVGFLHLTQLSVDNPRGISLYDFLRLGYEQNHAVDAFGKAVKVYAGSFGPVAVKYIFAGEQ